MITQPDLVGSRVRPRARAPSRTTAGRICVDPCCSTRLSIYNKRDTCFHHSPLRFPRTRGRTTSERPRSGGRNIVR